MASKIKVGDIVYLTDKGLIEWNRQEKYRSVKVIPLSFKVIDVHAPYYQLYVTRYFPYFTGHFFHDEIAKVVHYNIYTGKII